MPPRAVAADRAGAPRTIRVHLNVAKLLSATAQRTPNCYGPSPLREAALDGIERECVSNEGVDSPNYVELNDIGHSTLWPNRTIWCRCRIQASKKAFDSRLVTVHRISFLVG